MASGPDMPWTQAPLVALDLEGTGAQDRDDEAILEIALVPITAGRPAPNEAYTTLINPGRSIPRRPWISPGLTDATLATAPPLSDVEPELTWRLSGKILVGHNVSVDWRLLQRRCPAIQPAGLIDTLRLARHVHPELPPQEPQRTHRALHTHRPSHRTRTEQPAPSRPMGHSRRSTPDRRVDQRPSQQQIAQLH